MLSIEQRDMSCTLDSIWGKYITWILYNRLRACWPIGYRRWSLVKTEEPPERQQSRTSNAKNLSSYRIQTDVIKGPVLNALM